MAVFSFRTISTPAEGSYKEKGSKFLAFAYPVENETDIKERITLLKKQFFDARHHCYAWVLGADRKHVRAADDGEPNHSAGDPILGQIRSKELTNVLVVVVRYFGGVKLGIGGLIAAYKTAAEDALNNAIILEKEVFASLRLIYDFSATPEVMKLVKEFSMSIIGESYNEKAEIDLRFPLRIENQIREKLQILTAMGAKISVNDTVTE
ncbi:MAG TPA: YigZ family protein [Chryseosolibacter sp.]|nr:YigZ family protein [Chryseosolibacter sp.]